MSEALQAALVAIITTCLNAAVTYGIVKTQIAWLRRDVDEVRNIIFTRSKSRRKNDEE